MVTLSTASGSVVVDPVAAVPDESVWVIDSVLFGVDVLVMVGPKVAVVVGRQVAFKFKG